MRIKPDMKLRKLAQYVECDPEDLPAIRDELVARFDGCKIGKLDVRDVFQAVFDVLRRRGK